jgi:predicted ATPase
VLVFEDLHWADEGLLDFVDFVDYLADWAGGVPLLVVGPARPELLERRPGWGGGKPDALTLTLAPLSDQARPG